MTAEFVRERITMLRLKKGVSEYKMSYDLGHSRGYINNISSGKALPSLSELFAICEYFDISVIDFFNENSDDPKLINELSTKLEKLDRRDLEMVLNLVNRFLEK